MIFKHTDKKYWWQHTAIRDGKSFLHEWDASPRRVSGKSCPYCRGVKVMKGFNDLATRYPRLAAQWDTEANSGLLPCQFTSGSNHIVSWRCDICGHRWQTSINNRRRTGCPNCAHRRSTSFPEQALYFYLKQHFPNCQNRNVTALHGPELDILLPEFSIALEYNGLWAHSSKKKKESDARSAKSREKGILLIRVCESGENLYVPGEHLIYAGKTQLTVI